MAPGAYRVFAFKSPQPNLPYGDAEAMQPYETKGQVVSVISGPENECPGTAQFRQRVKSKTCCIYRMHAHRDLVDDRSVASSAPAP